MKLSTETITPTKARTMLAQNNGNRKVRPAVIDKYASDILAGNWLLTGDPIRFDVDGKLVDGQHRLLAIVQSGKAVKTVVARGVEHDVVSVIDTGAARNLSNVLTWLGEKHATNLGAVIVKCVRYETGIVNRPGVLISHEQALAWLDENPSVRDSVQIASEVAHGSGLKLPTSMIGMVHYEAAKTTSREDADAFFDQLASGVGIERDSAHYVLKKWALRTAGLRDKPRSYVYAAVLIKAYNAWESGDVPKHLVYRAGGPNPEPFPKIKPVVS